MLDILRKVKSEIRKIALYNGGSERIAHATESWYIISMEKMPLGVGLKGELMVMLLMNLDMEGSDKGVWSR